ncbi:MAG: hypothetical protein CVU56_10930 [Deltaproteobacteria bacterium HGW-Deltaproteobacteria-14]|nr:MAG: hypothetical protein CVU56_10930 [Deltaproteobacteria bacterium HGW-Deltaproteobacteria-14]
MEALIKAELPDLRVWTPLDAAATATRVTPQLKSGEKLAREALVGPIGPTDAAVLALIEVEGGPSRLTGALLVPGDGGAVKRVDLPLLDTRQLYEVEWVAMLNADEDGDREVVVRSTHLSGVGPEGAVPQPTVSVLDWDGEAVIRLEAAQRVLEGVATPEEARMRLLRERFEANRRAGRYAGPCAEVTGDYATTYAYDSYGSLVREATADSVRNHRYDAAGNLLETVTTWKDAPPVTSTYTTDARGLIVASRELIGDDDGAPTLVAAVNTYDARGRLVRESSIGPEGVHHVTYQWKGQRLVASDHDFPDSDEFCAPTPPIKHEEDAQGRTIREEFRETPGMCEDDRDETWRYDAAGNLVEHRVHTLSGEPDVVTTYEYGCWTNPKP